MGAPRSLLFRRPPQRATPFVPGDLDSPYYNDLGAGEALELPAATRRLAELTAHRDALNPVTVAQLGLVAWERRDEPGWLELAAVAAESLAAAADADGAVHYRFRMPHTYALEPPWCSAMAQGQAASLLVRVGRSAGRDDLREQAQAVLRPLLAGDAPLVAATPEGPVLQEYPTSPPAHVLNGWIFALFGLYDVAATGPRESAAAGAFATGAATVAARVHLYETWGGWSRYDLYPHPVAHVASPFYHRLHAELLRALDRLAPDPRLRAAAARFEVAAAGTLTASVALVRKGVFRLVRPRRGRLER